MLATPRLIAYLLLEVGILSIAGRIWLEFRRDEKRRRLAESVANTLTVASAPAQEQLAQPQETPLQRAA